MFYRQHKTLWYQFCNFKHFLKAENSEDSLASSCVDFSIGLSCNPVWVTIETSIMTMMFWYSNLFNRFAINTITLDYRLKIKQVPIFTTDKVYATYVVFRLGDMEPGHGIE